ncbi:MAG: hypothetical protein R2695_17840 [Acidimicrobiales bacterium]
MTKPMGSVYLDGAARPSRRPPVPRVDETRTRLGSFLLIVGLVALSLVLLIEGINSRVLSPTATADHLDTALDDPVARAEIRDRLAGGMAENLVGPEAIAAAAAFGFDVDAEARRIADVALDDPVVRAALRSVVDETRYRIVEDHTAAPVDTATLDAAVVHDHPEESPG